MNGPSADVKKFMPLQLLQVLGRNTPGLIQASNESIKKTEEQIQAIIDQLFLVTASGRYLVQLGEERGFIMPDNSGLDIRSYRTLVPIMVSDPKQVRITIDSLIQAFYGSERAKPNATSIVAAPYNLKDGDNLIIETESGTADVSITSEQVSDFNNISAGEITAVLNSSQSLYTASVDRDRNTGEEFVTISSKTPGAGSFVRVAGGTLQNILKIPSYLEQIQPAPGTNWNLSRTDLATDVLRFTWDGAGINPNVYFARAGDVVTIRGLEDGAADYSKLNGTYPLVDVGYDYFIIRNETFNETSSLLIQPTSDNIVFTRNERLNIFDNDEFALSSETDDQTITITVPAVPPLARRFLQGSAHLHGWNNRVIDFTRTSLQTSIEQDEEKAQGDNTFVLRTNVSRPDFNKKQFKTGSVSVSDSTPLYSVQTGDEQFNVLPYTTSQLLDGTQLFAELGTNEVTLQFPFRHGLSHRWGFTLEGFTGLANLTPADINKEHVAACINDDNSITFQIFNSDGTDKKFTGESFGSASVYREDEIRQDGADFYLDFGTQANALASGLTKEVTFSIDPLSGTIINLPIANKLFYRKFSVLNISDGKVYFSAGQGIGSQGIIISGATGARSAFFGGSSGAYFFDKTSDYNQKNVMTDLFVNFTSYTPHSNPEFVGSFLFDPNGERSDVSISSIETTLAQPIPQGAAQRVIFVNKSKKEFPQQGKIVFEYGFGSFEGPIDYTAYVTNDDNTQILIDPAYRFKNSQPAGAKVSFINQDMPYDPTLTGEDFPVYITGTSAARNTMFELIRLLVATGIFVESDVLFPELRYADVSIPPFE